MFVNNWKWHSKRRLATSHTNTHTHIFKDAMVDAKNIEYIAQTLTNHVNRISQIKSLMPVHSIIYQDVLLCLCVYAK